METSNKTKNRSKKKRHKQKELNIGLLVYFFIFSYLVYCIINFITSKETMYVSAENGRIYDAEYFDGVIIRNEKVISSPTEGILTFYVPEGSKIKKDGLVATIDNSGKFTDSLKKELQNINNSIISKAEMTVDNSNYKSIINDLNAYSINYNENNFYGVYNLKNSIYEKLSKISRSVILEKNKSIDTLINDKLLYEDKINESVTLVKADKSGIISYNIDGLEDIDVGNIDVEKLFKPADVQRTLDKEKAVMNQYLFKIIDNHNWYILSEISNELKEYIHEKKYITINIVDKNLNVDAKIYDQITNGKKEYLILEIDRYIPEFIDIRKINFEVVYKHFDGIKIPNTAIINKDFIKIPIDYIGTSGNSKGFLKKVYGEEFVGGESISFVKLGFYYKDDDYYYILSNRSDLKINDTIVTPDNKNQYTLSDKKELLGVYIINKSYTNFKLVEVLYENDQYTIVKTNTPYGVRLYDRIIADISTVEENIIVQ